MRTPGLRVAVIIAMALACASAALAQGSPAALNCGASIDSTLTSQGFDSYTIAAQAGDSLLLLVLAAAGAAVGLWQRLKEYR